MNEKRTVGIGAGGTDVSLVLASCPLKFAALGALGMTGVLGSAWFETIEPLFIPALIGYGAFTVYGVVRLFRRRRAAAIPLPAREIP